MSLAPGTRLGPYEVVSDLGAGGMGEVYRATDRNLKRSVAIKVLPALVAGDADRLARFQLEAEVLAALNHPNIAAIYGLEKTPDLTALVMELVEGEDLSAHIAPGPIPLAEALPIAKQIADALEAAHEQGIIHRDLKPANIKVRADGTVKVLDFGLAKAMDPAGASSGEAMNSPTMTARATQMGMILGTAAYMAPEQAKGKAVDRRADIWAFGVVLYEMVTGRRLFDAEDISETLAAVLTRDVSLTALPSDIPLRLRALLRDCLVRDPKQRVRDIGDARLALDKIIAGAPDDAATSATAPAATVPSRARERFAWAAAGVFAFVAVAAGVWALRPAPAGPAPPVARLTLSLPPGDRFPPTQTRSLAVSPDGSRIAFVSTRDKEQPQIFVRELDSGESKALPGTENADSLFFSPDGKWLGFASGGKLLKVAMAGGGPLPLCAAAYPRGASWTSNRTIVFAPQYGTRGLEQVSESGGASQPILSRNPNTGEEADRWPELLPGGRSVLFTAWSRNQDASQIVIERLDTHERRVIVRGGTSARYSPTGHIVYARGAVLWAIPFDLSRLETTGEPISVASGVLLTPEGAAQFDLSTTGLLVYLPGTAGRPVAQPVWVDRNGGHVPLAAPARPYMRPRLSPNGQQVALEISDEKNDSIAVWDIPTSRLYALPTSARSASPTWTPDGERIVFRSVRDGVFNVFSTLANGGGDEKRLTTSPVNQTPQSVSPDGQVVLVEGGSGTLVLPLNGSAKPRPLFEGTAGGTGSFSSDGRWMCYGSTQSGRSEIWAMAFPSGQGSRQVSTEGGSFPRWARRGLGEELYYQSGTKMMAVELTTQPTLTVGKTRVLFEIESVPGAGFDVTRDGQHFLMLLARTEGQAATQASQVNVVLNWFEELERRVKPEKQ